MQVVAKHVIEAAGEDESTVTLRTTCISRPVGVLAGRLGGALTQEIMGLEAAGLKRRAEEND